MTRSGIEGEYNNFAELQIGCRVFDGCGLRSIADGQLTTLQFTFRPTHRTTFVAAGARVTVMDGSVLSMQTITVFPVAPQNSPKMKLVLPQTQGVVTVEVLIGTNEDDDGPDATNVYTAVSEGATTTVTFPIPADEKFFYVVKIDGVPEILPTACKNQPFGPEAYRDAHYRTDVGILWMGEYEYSFEMDFAIPYHLMDYQLVATAPLVPGSCD